ncbi:hypothetical protein Trydic_g15553 [Trypoxylus dichotomus]
MELAKKEAQLMEPSTSKEAVLGKQDVLYPVTTREWATPIVAVHKKRNTSRICRDYKITVNPASATEYYWLPNVNDIVAQLKQVKVGHETRFVHLDHLRFRRNNEQVSNDFDKGNTVEVHPMVELTQLKELAKFSEKRGEENRKQIDNVNQPLEEILLTPSPISIRRSSRIKKPTVKLNL